MKPYLSQPEEKSKKPSKFQSIRQSIRNFGADESGIGTLEMLLIIAVIVVLAILFRKWIVGEVKNLFEKNSNNIDQFNNDISSTPDTTDPSGTSGS